TRDSVELLRTAIESILDKTTYPDYEILIVDNRSEKAETCRFFRQLTAQHANIRILPYDHDFNYSAINNHAVRHANGHVVGLLNNDVEIISADWLDEMVGHALRPEVGC